MDRPNIVRPQKLVVFRASRINGHLEVEYNFTDALEDRLSQLSPRGLMRFHRQRLYPLREIN